MGRPHGLDGFLGIYVDEDDVVSLDAGSLVYLGDDAYSVRELRRTDRGFQIAFAEVADRETAEDLRGRDVAVTERRPLVEGEYWPEQLVGLAVYDDGGNEVGAVEAVLPGPGQDRLVVSGEMGRFEVPFVDALVPVVDLEEGRVEIVVIPGLIDESG